MVLARWLDVHASATCTRLVGGATWHPPACGALQDCGRSKAEVARPARVEKDPQGRLYLAAEVCQLRTPIRTGDSGGAARPACLLTLVIFVIYTPNSDILSAELCRSVCGAPQRGAVYQQLAIPVSLRSTFSPRRK